MSSVRSYANRISYWYWPWIFAYALCSNFLKMHNNEEFLVLCTCFKHNGSWHRFQWHISMIFARLYYVLIAVGPRTKHWLWEYLRSKGKSKVGNRKEAEDWRSFLSFTTEIFSFCFFWWISWLELRKIQHSFVTRLIEEQLTWIDQSIKERKQETTL